MHGRRVRRAQTIAFLITACPDRTVVEEYHTISNHRYGSDGGVPRSPLSRLTGHRPCTELELWTLWNYVHGCAMNAGVSAEAAFAALAGGAAAGKRKADNGNGGAEQPFPKRNRVCDAAVASDGRGEIAATHSVAATAALPAAPTAVAPGNPVKEAARPGSSLPSAPRSSRRRMSER